MIYVITPYHREDMDIIRAAHRSVLAQEQQCTHVLVADGHPRAEMGTWDCQHVVLPSAHRDGGSFARGVGASHALHEGADYVAFLDADNWFEPDHVSSLLTLARERRTPVTVSRRTLRRVDGSLLDGFEPDSDGLRFADTSTILLRKDAHDIVDLMQRLPREVGVICDQLIWLAINERGYAHACTGSATMNYRTRYGAHYATRGEPPPDGATFGGVMERAKDYWNGLSDDIRLRLIKGRA